jgi:hypothetical protein
MDCAKLTHMTDMTPAKLRKAAEDALRPVGQRRVRLVTELEALDAELLPLVVSARQNEVSIRRISELTALAPGTIQAWMKRAEQESNDN